MKLGLVLEGGAIRTIYSCGVTDAFNDKNIMADYIIGVSAGAGYGVSYASNQPGRNYKIIMNYVRSPKYMGLGNLINPRNKSYFDLNYVYHDIPNHLVPFDMEAFQTYKGEFKAVVTNVDTGEAEYLDVERSSNSHNTVLKATCALPILSPIIRYHGKNYLDGGIADSIPYKKAFEAGCDKVIVVLTREYDYVKTESKALKHALIHYRNFPKLCEAMKTRAMRYNQETEELKELEKEGKVFIFRPDNVEGFKRNERNLDKIRDLYNQGYLSVKERYDDLIKYLYE